MSGVLVPVTRLQAVCDPFESCPWDGPGVTKEAVRMALESGRLVKEPGGADHAGRIAYLVVHEAVDAIEVDVGIPVLNYRPNWMVLDGNHRLAAAIFAGREVIRADVAGQLDYATELFDVDCEVEDESVHSAGGCTSDTE